MSHNGSADSVLSCKLRLWKVFAGTILYANTKAIHSLAICISPDNAA